MTILQHCAKIMVVSARPTITTAAITRSRTSREPRRPFLALILTALVATGVGLFLVGSSLPTASAGVAGTARPVNAGAADPLDITAHNSPSLVRNPSDPANLVVVDRIDTPRFSCALHVSTDGGATWAEIAIPFPGGEELPARCFAPDVAFGPDATLYLSFVTLEGPGNRPHAVWLTTSSDGGRTLSTPSRVAGAFAFGVRVVADPSQPARVYLTWLQSETTATLAFPDPGNPLVVTRSDDGGATWSEPQQASPPSRTRVVAPSLAAGRDGRLFLLYLDLGDDSLDYHGAHEGRGGPPYRGSWSLVLARSTDGGATWSETTVEDAVVPTERFIVFFPPTPSLAIDPQDDRVYAAFQDGRLGDTDVWLWTSEDGGVTFASPTRVNDTPGRDGTAQYRPKLDIAPSGRLDIVYYDRRSDPNDLFNEVSLQSSDDHGSTFGPRLRLSDRSFDSRIGSGSERNLPDLGSRLGLVSSDERTVAVWTDTRGGTEVSNKQDLAVAAVAFTVDSRLRAPLRSGGAILAVGASVALIAAGLRRRVRQKPMIKGPMSADAARPYSVD